MIQGGEHLTADVVPSAHAALNRMADFTHRVLSGEWRRHTGRSIRNVINVGIGGSDPGPVMVPATKTRLFRARLLMRRRLRRVFASAIKPHRVGVGKRSVAA
jgi:glucose-6-phosphate isomerase